MKISQAETLRRLDALAQNRCLDKQDFNPTDWLSPAEARQWKKLVALNEKGKIAADPHQIICVVEGGLLREVWATDHSVKVTLFDFDDERQKENARNEAAMSRMKSQWEYKEVF